MRSDAATDGIVVGTLAGPHASVDPDGSVHVGGTVVHWQLAADDGWHDPRRAVLRQRRVGGTPVVESRLRIPSGDAVARVWSVPDGGGWTLIEIANESPLPIVAAFSGPVLAARSATPTEPRGIVPGDAAEPVSLALAVGHRTTVRVGVPTRAAGALAPGLPGWEAVQRGWELLARRGSRLELPEPSWSAAVVECRCDALLGRLPGRRQAWRESLHDGDEQLAAEALIAAGEVARAGVSIDDELPELAETASRLGATSRPSWVHLAALRGARLAFAASGDERAVDDTMRVARRLGARCAADEQPSAAMPSSIAAVPWIEQRCVSDDGVLLPGGWPRGWLGAPLAVHDLPVGRGTLSFAVRWHGARPAVLWESAGIDRPLRAAAAVGGSWTSTEPSGEALWPAPDGS